MKEPSQLIKNRMKATTEFRDSIYLKRRRWNQIVLLGMILLLALPIILFLVR